MISSEQIESSRTNQNINNNNAEDELTSIGSAKTLRRAMQVTKLNDMINCFKDLKFYSKTIEKDLPEYFHDRKIDQSIDSPSLSTDTTDFIQLARDTSTDRQYIVLHDLVKQEQTSTPTQSSRKKSRHDRSSSLELRVKMMKHVIAAQPSALEGIYLEALLNPDQWKANHHHLQTSPLDIFTLKERQRLTELLKQFK